MQSRLPDLNLIDITPKLAHDINIIQYYSNLSFTIQNQKITGNFSITPDIIREFNSDEELIEIAKQIMSQKNETIFLYGSDDDNRRNAAEAKCIGANIHIETMSIGSAARTYNALVQDGREICAFFELNVR